MTASEDLEELQMYLAQSFEPDVFLIIGASESVTGVSALLPPQRHLRSVFCQLSSGVNRN